MKCPLHLLLAALLLTSCHEASNESVPSSAPVGTVPSHPSLELYINQYGLSPRQGVISRPGLMELKPNFRATVTASTHQGDKPPYSAKLEYLGTVAEEDHYRISITHPVNDLMKTFSKEVMFKGQEIEVFRDSTYRIGIRARSDEIDEAK